MAVTKVRSDEKGIYVRTNGDVFRPGLICGYAHAHDMSDGGLVQGAEVRVHAVSGTTTCNVRLADGRSLRWGDDYMHALEATQRRGNQSMTEAEFEAIGIRTSPIMEMVRAKDGLPEPPRGPGR